MYLMSRYIKIYQDICYIYNYIVTGRAPSDKTKTTSKWESQLLNGCPHPFHTWLSHSETVSCFGLHKRILQRFRTAATDWTGKSKVTLSLPCPMAARYEYPLPPSPSSLSHNAWRHIGFGSSSWFAHGLAMEDAAWWKITLVKTKILQIQTPHVASGDTDCSSGIFSHLSRSFDLARSFRVDCSS